MKDLFKQVLETQKIFIEDLLSLNKKYELPVVMEVCSLSEVKKMTYQELLHVRKIAILKLDLQIINQAVSMAAKIPNF